MPLYIPWLTETIKKRGVRYLLHLYLGHFFEEKLTLEQLSIDIYEGKGSIKDLALDVDGLNDELDFIPFRFLEGCSIGQISVEVPWSSLATEACRVELDEAKFVCRLKTSADSTKTHCTESTLLTRSLMTSSMQMAEDIVTTEDDDEYDSPNSSSDFTSQQHHKKKDVNQMLDGLEMFAQLIDSVLRRTKLTARNTLFQIQPHEDDYVDDIRVARTEDDDSSQDNRPNKRASVSLNDGREFSDSASYSEDSASSSDGSAHSGRNPSERTVEFFIRFFRCEEKMDQASDDDSHSRPRGATSEEPFKKPLSAMPETITKLLTLEDVEMRIGGSPVSNLIGRHTIMIKYNGQKSEISIFSGSPLLAVIGHEQLETFFNVFDSAGEREHDTNLVDEADQKVMSPEDYAKIENQLLESAPVRGHPLSELDYGSNRIGGRRWVDGGEPTFSDVGSRRNKDSDLQDFRLPNNSDAKGSIADSNLTEPSLDNIEAFSLELKLPGIWLCILRDGEKLPPLIKPYADSINSFQTINKYIDQHIKVPHIRLLALKVALDITSTGINAFLGDLDISEYQQDDTKMNPTLHLLHNDLKNLPMNTSRYKASIINNREINIELLTKTRVLLDPTMIDRIVEDYKLVKLKSPAKQSRNVMATNQQQQPRGTQLDLSFTIRGEEFLVELLCPIPDLTPEASSKRTQLRPQSFLFDFCGISLSWHSDKLDVSCEELIAYVKSRPQQSDIEAIKFIDASSKDNNKIVLSLEPSPSNLDTAFPNEIEQALNESSMYDSIYVGHTTESNIPTGAFQTKRKVVRANLQQSTGSGASKHEQANEPTKASSNECDNEKILTPGDRQHLSTYLDQTVMSTKLSLSLVLPNCEVEFEDKEQLDLIYNRFANDFVFWQPRCLSGNGERSTDGGDTVRRSCRGRRGRKRSSETTQCEKYPNFKEAMEEFSSDGEDRASDSDRDDGDQESENSYHSLSIEGSMSDCYDNEVTCKVTVDELIVRFNHQSCAAAMKQEISADNLLLGVVIDVNRKPGTLLSLVADNLELSTDSAIVLNGNHFGDKNSTLSLTAEIKRPTKCLKDIKLAIQLVNGLFSDFKAETFTRFWQSVNVTDEPIAGYVSPKIVTELHIDVLGTALSLVREGARPALLSVDELYLTSMVMERTSQVMIRMIADEVSLYLRKNKRGLDVMKNYICLIDSGLIDLDVKFSEDGKLEFGVINNVITVRACQDSLSALCGLFNVLVKSSSNINKTTPDQPSEPVASQQHPVGLSKQPKGATMRSNKSSSSLGSESAFERANQQEVNLLEDAMNNFTDDEHGAQHDEPEADDDLPPTFGFAEPTDDDDDYARHRQRDPGACLLDESNPLIGDFFSQPLLPSPDPRPLILTDDDDDDDDDDRSSRSFGAHLRQDDPINDSGFFVIGDDDVGAGIIDKSQREPVVRKLIEGPINIVENHFKMTKPRTIPEMLANSLERYVLEEMTLVVNLYGGRDFDDEKEAKPSEPRSERQEQDGAEAPDTTSSESLSIRGRAASINATPTATTSPTNRRSLPAGASRKHCLSDSAGSLRRKGGRRKHLSEGSSSLAGAQYQQPARACGAANEPRVRFGEGAVNLWESLDLMSAPDFAGSSRRRPSGQPPMSADSKMAGGTWRQTDVCIQLTLSKVKLLYELGGEGSPISWRSLLFIHEIEIKDRIQASDINKMLYEYCTESMPKRNTQMLTVKNVATINPSDGCEECDLRVSLKPLRLNIDQDTLLFLIEFFTAFSKSLAQQELLLASEPTSAAAGGSPSSSARASSDNRQQQQGRAARRSSERSDFDGSQVGESNESDLVARQHRSSRSSSSSASSTSGAGAAHEPSARPSATTTTSGQGDDLPTHCHVDSVAGSANQQPIYIKSFTFSPDVPIRLDYHAKHLDFEQGALAGILMGLAHLDHSELVLRRVQAKHGMRGLDRLLLFTLNSWLSDIKRNQLPSILSGVGPMHSVIQLFQGMRDLVWMPIDHYRKDRRLVRGLQRGASSFSSSTAMAAINLVNRFISIVQCTAQIAHDIVTPPATRPSADRRGAYRAQGLAQARSAAAASPAGNQRRQAAAGQAQSGSQVAGLNQPRNFCEGVAVGFTILREGFSDTARNVAVGMQADDVRSAVGELVRQIPSTLLSPIISATEGAQNVLVGIRNQIAPDARREDQEKWKRRVWGK